MKDTSLLGDVDSVSKVSDVRSGEAGESKEPGMGCKRGVGKINGRREELGELEEDDDDGSAGRLVNLPVAGSRYDLLIKGVAGGNQR